MAKKLTAKRAEELAQRGITHIASVVNQCYDTQYYRVSSLDEILSNGGFARKGSRYTGCRNGQYFTCSCEAGVTGSQIDWEHTIRWSEI